MDRKGFFFAAAAAALLLCMFGCAAADTLLLPEDMISIEAETFSGDVSITEAVLPDGLEEIGGRAFSGCPIVRIVFPDSLKDISDDAFDSLTEVFVTDEASYACGWADKNRIRHIYIYQTDGGAAAVTRYKAHPIRIPYPMVAVPREINGVPVTSIAEGAFRTDVVREITFPDTLQSIGDYAFFDCYNLTRVCFSEGVKTIGSHAFANCPNLDDIVIPEGVTAIGDCAFSGCGQIGFIQLPESVGSIGDNAIPETCTVVVKRGSYADEWAAATGHSALYMNDGTDVMANGECGDAAEWTLTWDGTLTVFGQGAIRSFEDDFSMPDEYSKTGFHPYEQYIRRIVIEDGITAIGDYAFTRCFNASQAVIPEGVTSIGFAAFAQSGIVSITIPASVSFIDDRMVGYFDECASLAEINVDPDNAYYRSSDGVLFDKPGAVLLRYPMAKAGSYRVPDGVARVGTHAFYACSELTSLEISDSVTAIGTDAIEDCDRLETISIGKSAAELGNFGTYAICGCRALVRIDVDPENEAYYSVEGVLFRSIYERALVCYPPGRKDAAYVVPDGIEVLERFAFLKADKLRIIVVPESVMLLDMACFQECYDLRLAEIRGMDTQIDDSAFSGHRDDLVIRCRAGSYASRWAEEKGIDLEFLDVETE